MNRSKIMLFLSILFIILLTVKGENFCSKTYNIRKNDRLKVLEITEVNDTPCIVLFKAASASRRIKISVEKIDYRYGSVYIYDGNATSPNLVANLSSDIQSYKFTSSGQLLAVKIEKGNKTIEESYKIVLSYVLKTPFTCTENSQSKKKVVKCKNATSCAVFCNLKQYFPKTVFQTNISCSNTSWKQEAKDLCIHRKRVLKYYRKHDICPEATDIYLNMLEPLDTKTNTKEDKFQTMKKITRCSKVCDKNYYATKYLHKCRDFDHSCRWLCIKSRYLNGRCERFFGR